MTNEAAFSALTLLVATCEKVVLELETVQPRPWRLLQCVARTHDEAVDVARGLAPEGDSSA